MSRVEELIQAVWQEIDKIVPEKLTKSEPPFKTVKDVIEFLENIDESKKIIYFDFTGQVTTEAVSGDIGFTNVPQDNRFTLFIKTKP